MRVHMKEPVELEPMKKIDEIRRFSNKELRLSKESMGALPNSSEYCEPIRKKSYSYVSGILGIAYNPFLNEDIRHFFFDYEQVVLLRFRTSRIATIRSSTNQLTKLRLVLEKSSFSAKIGKPSGVSIGILRRTAENEFDGSVGTNETVMASHPQRRFDITSNRRCAEGTEFRL